MKNAESLARDVVIQARLEGFEMALDSLKLVVTTLETVGSANREKDEALKEGAQTCVNYLTQQLKNLKQQSGLYNFSNTR